MENIGLFGLGFTFTFPKLHVFHLVASFPGQGFASEGLGFLVAVFLFLYSSAVSPWVARCFLVMTLKDAPHSRQVTEASLMAFFGSIGRSALSALLAAIWPVLTAAIERLLVLGQASPFPWEKIRPRAACKKRHPRPLPYLGNLGI